MKIIQEVGLERVDTGDIQDLLHADNETFTNDDL